MTRCRCTCDGGGGGGFHVSAGVYNSVDQPSAFGATTPVSNDTERWDYGGLWVPGTPTRLTAPEEGVYAIGWNGWITAAPDDNTTASILAINAAIVIDQDAHPASGLVFELFPVLLQRQYKLNAGDYAEVYINSACSAGVTIVTLANFSPEFYMTLVSTAP